MFMVHKKLSKWLAERLTCQWESSASSALAGMGINSRFWRINAAWTYNHTEKERREWAHTLFSFKCIGNSALCQPLAASS